MRVEAPRALVGARSLHDREQRAGASARGDGLTAAELGQRERQPLIGARAQREGGVRELRGVRPIVGSPVQAEIDLQRPTGAVGARPAPLVARVDDRRRERREIEHRDQTAEAQAPARPPRELGQEPRLLVHVDAAELALGARESARLLFIEGPALGPALRSG